MVTTASLLSVCSNWSDSESLRTMHGMRERS